MVDRDGRNIYPGYKVRISKSAIKKYKLTIREGVVINTEQLVSVSTHQGIYDFHAKSLTVIF
jgi:hypothetical protein